MPVPVEIFVDVNGNGEFGIAQVAQLFFAVAPHHFPAVTHLSRRRVKVEVAQKLKGLPLQRFEGLNGLGAVQVVVTQDRKSTRLNSSHVRISYAIFCLKKKKKKNNEHI